MQDDMIPLWHDGMVIGDMVPAAKKSWQKLPRNAKGCQMLAKIDRSVTYVLPFIKPILFTDFHIFFHQF